MDMLPANQTVAKGMRSMVEALGLLRSVAAADFLGRSVDEPVGIQVNWGAP